MTMSHDTPPRGKGCVLYLIVLLILGALIYLVASSDAGGSRSASPATASTRTTPSPEPGVVVNDSSASVEDAAYLSTLHAAYPYWSGGTDMELVQAGHQACSALTEGNQAWAVSIALAAVYELDTGQAAYLTGAAIGSYCPDAAGSLT